MDNKVQNEYKNYPLFQRENGNLHLAALNF